MNDDNWDTIGGPIANQIEVLNATNQINVLDGLVMFLLAHRGPSGTGNPPMPDEVALCHLHHAGTLFLLDEPGRYRNIEVEVVDAAGTVVHKPGVWQNVPRDMKVFFRQLSSVWTSGDALDVAAYSLWAINFIHPFRNGNGRTARAFAYACLCIRLGTSLPGTVTVVDLIMANRLHYEAALRAADDSFTKTKIPDLAPMKKFLSDLLQLQIQSAVAAAQAEQAAQAAQPPQAAPNPPELPDPPAQTP